jgi:hypothetical protein
LATTRRTSLLAPPPWAPSIEHALSVRADALTAPPAAPPRPCVAHRRRLGCRVGALADSFATGGGARNLLLSPTALSTITCALACPHLRCRASRLAMRKRACAGCRAPRLNRLPSVASRPCARQVARCRRRDRDESPTEAALLVAPVLVGASVLTLLGTLVVGAVLVVTVRASLAACCWVCPPVAACTRRRAPHAPSRAAASRLRSGCTGRAPRTTRRAPRRSSPTTAACLRCNLHRVECVRPERCIRARRVAAYAACVRCPVGAVQLVRCWQRRLLRRPLLTAARFCESRLDLARVCNGRA